MNFKCMDAPVKGLYHSIQVIEHFCAACQSVKVRFGDDGFSLCGGQ